MKHLKFSVPFATLALIACASSEKSVPSGVDMFKVEATANEALKLAKTDSSQIAAYSAHIDFLNKRIDLLDSILSSMPIAAADENKLQIALLREEVIFLRKFLEGQDKVPLVNPSRENPPNAPGYFPPEYEQAQYLFTNKKYAEAATAFEKVTVLYPKSDWTDDAWYWAGESQMALGNYAQAISAYEKVFFFTQSIKHADAQYQIGMCLVKMGDSERAKPMLRKVIEFYPKSSRSLQAKNELNKLK